MQQQDAQHTARSALTRRRRPPTTSFLPAWNSRPAGQSYSLKTSLSQEQIPHRPGHAMALLLCSTVWQSHRRQQQAQRRPLLSTALLRHAPSYTRCTIFCTRPFPSSPCLTLFTDIRGVVLNVNTFLPFVQIQTKICGINGERCEGPAG